MVSKIIPLMISFFSLGVIVMPQALTLFAGEHNWYDLSSNQSDVPCEKCHADIADEMNQIVSVHTGESAGEPFRCEYCHRTFEIDNSIYQSERNINVSIQEEYAHEYSRASSIKVVPGKSAHATSTVPCLYCHSGQFSDKFHNLVGPNDFCICHGDNDGGDDKYYHGDRFFTGDPDTGEPDECSNCHSNTRISFSQINVKPVPAAGGFGWSMNSTDTASNAAHASFIAKSINSDTLEHCNEACIACHTATPVKLNITRLRSLEFQVGLEEQLTTRYGIHNYSVGNWEYNNSAKITVWGNTTGEGSTDYGGIEWPGDV